MSFGLRPTVNPRVSQEGYVLVVSGPLVGRSSKEKPLVSGLGVLKLLSALQTNLAADPECWTSGGYRRALPNQTGRGTLKGSSAECRSG